MLDPASPLEGLHAPPPHDNPGVTPRELRGLALTALHGAATMLPGLPQRLGYARVACGTAIWLAPGQWLVLHAPDATPDVSVEHRTDLTGARCILEVAGPRVREVLATMLPLDLHPRAFRPDAAAATLAAHIPVLLCATVKPSASPAINPTAARWLRRSSRRRAGAD